MRLPTQSIAKGEALVHPPVVLVEESGVEQDRACGVLIDLRNLVSLRGLVQVICRTAESVLAVRSPVGVVSITISTEAGAEIQGMIAFGCCKVVLQLINILVVAHHPTVVATGIEQPLDDHRRRIVLRNVLVPKTAVLETDIINQVLAEHQAVTYLQRVLHAFRIGGLRGERQLPHYAIVVDRTEKFVAERQGIRLPKLQVEPRADVNTRGGIGNSLVQRSTLRVFRSDAGRVNRIHHVHILDIAPENADKVRRRL